jgi:hypothetical protein
MKIAKDIEQCIRALHAYRLAVETYASSVPAQTMIGDIATALAANNGEGSLCRDVAEAIRQSTVAPAQRDARAG